LKFVCTRDNYIRVQDSTNARLNLLSYDLKMSTPLLSRQFKQRKHC